MGRGGKTLFDEQVFQGRFQGGLVALDREQIVPASLEEDVLGRFILGVHCVGHHDLAPQRLAAQQLAGGGDFVGLGRRDHTAQKTALGIDSIDDLHSGVTDFLAIDDDDPILPGAQKLILPAQECPFHLVVVDLMQHAGKGGLPRTT